MSNPQKVRAYLQAHQPASRTLIAQYTGLTGQEVATALRGMKKAQTVTHTPDGYILGPKEPRKKWACPKERASHYSLEYQRRMQSDTGEAGERWRASRAQTNARMRQKAKPSPKPVQKPSVAVRVVTGEHAARDKREAARAILMAKTSAMASKAPKVEPMETVEQFLARGGRIEPLPAFTYSQSLKSMPAYGRE